MRKCNQCAKLVTHRIGGLEMLNLDFDAPLSVTHRIGGLETDKTIPTAKLTGYTPHRWLRNNRRTLWGFLGLLHTA